jgi:hypothetical protein
MRTWPHTIGSFKDIFAEVYDLENQSGLNMEKLFLKRGFGYESTIIKI